MELRILDCHGLPERSIISINSRPTRQTLLTGPCPHPFKLPSSIWPLCIDLFSRIGKTGATASLEKADGESCYKVSLDSFDDRPMSITFRMQAASGEKSDADTCIDEYCRRHQMNTFLQENFDLLLEHRPDDPYDFLAKRFREAAVRESAPNTIIEVDAQDSAPPGGKEAVILENSSDMHQAKSAMFRPPPLKLRARKVLSEVSEQRLVNALLKAGEVTPKQRAFSILAKCMNNDRLEVALGHLPSLYEAPEHQQVARKDARQKLLGETDAPMVAEKATEFAAWTQGQNDEGIVAKAVRPQPIAPESSALGKERDATSRLSESAPDASSAKPRVSVGSESLSKARPSLMEVTSRGSSSNTPRVSKACPGMEPRTSVSSTASLTLSNFCPSHAEVQLRLDEYPEQSTSDLGHLVPTHIQLERKRGNTLQDSTQYTSIGSNDLAHFVPTHTNTQLSIQGPDPSNLDHLIPVHIVPESISQSSNLALNSLPDICMVESGWREQGISDLTHLVPTHIRPASPSQHEVLSISSDLSHLVPAHMEPDVDSFPGASSYVSANRDTACVPSSSEDLLHLVPTNLGTGMEVGTMNHEFECPDGSVSNLSHLVPTHLEKRSGSVAPSQSDLAHLIPSSEPLEIASAVTREILDLSHLVPTHVGGTCESQFLPSRQPERSTNAQYHSAPELALTQASLDLAHHLAHIGPTAETVDSREIQGRLSSLAVVPSQVQIDSKIEADSADLPHLVPVHTAEGQELPPLCSSRADGTPRDASDLLHLVPANVATGLPPLSELVGFDRTPKDVSDLSHLVPAHVTTGLPPLPELVGVDGTPRDASDHSAPELALTQASLDLAHHLTHIGPTAETVDSREIQGHLSSLVVVPSRVQIDSKIEADLPPLPELVPSEPASLQMKKVARNSPRDSGELMHFVPDHAQAILEPGVHSSPALRVEASTTDLKEFVPTHIMVEPSLELSQAPSSMREGKPHATQGRDLDISGDVVSDTPRLSQFMPVFHHLNSSFANLARLPEDEDTPRLSDFIPAGSSAASTTDSVDLEGFTPDQHQFIAKDVSEVLEHTPRLSSFVP